MRIVLAAGPAAPSLEDPDDFTAFAVAAPAGSESEMEDLVGALGRYDGTHVWVDRAALAGLAGERAHDPAWKQGLAQMVDYAEANGFLSDDGAAIRAHVEWES